MRYPKNQIKENQYTSGGEFMIAGTNQIYTGFYWQFKDKFFTGKSPSNSSVELTRISSTSIKKIEISNNISRSARFALGSSTISKLASSINTFPTVVPKSTNDKRYFAKKLNQFPIVIKEINEDTYFQLKQNSIYQVIIIDGSQIYPGSQEMNKAEQQMTGIKAFLGV